ncbi:MAG: tRNA lysidine(34) synthetase TilS [Lachnospirales bacterium]
MIDKVIKTISQFNMIKKGDKIVVGVSGGADSVCLLDILCSFKTDFDLDIIAVHINHNIRGVEAYADESYVVELCEKYNIPVKVFSYPCEELAKENGLSTEEMGRRLRYKAFNEVAGKEGKIAVAHNINDNCETMLLNFFRGTGLKGLCGISPVRGNIIRPLIACEKSEIENYCKENNLHYCIDSTNLEENYTRNKLRLSIIPLIEEGFNKVLSPVMYRTSNILREEEKFIELQALEAYNFCLSGKNRISIDKLLTFHKVIQRRVIRIGFRDFLVDLHDVSYEHIESVLALCKGESGKIANLPSNLRAIKEHNDLYFYKEDNISKTFSYNIPLENKVYIKEFNFYILLTKIKENAKNCKILYTNSFDCDKINGELILRSRKEKDKIFLKGVGGNKTIKKLFIDLKIPRLSRENIPLLAIGNDILWVKDYKTSDYYKASADTKNVLYLFITED